MDEYGINSFGVSVTTLEEVFMKVGEGSEKTVDDLYVLHIVTYGISEVNCNTSSCIVWKESRFY